MADVFVSYAQKDRARAEQVANALRAAGWEDVWWDAHLHVGSHVRSEIERQLHAARCVLVLWSEASIKSDWVIDEAQDGKNRAVLVQALIEDVQPPHGFRGIHWADLRRWTGDAHAREFAHLTNGISKFAPVFRPAKNRPTAQFTERNSPLISQSVKGRSLRWAELKIGAMALVFLVIAVLLIYFLGSSPAQ